jgi:uncharacterized protein YbjT (DUF2867 family)
VRILVTGASGFVGSLLTEALLRDGHSVRAFGRDAQRIERALETPERALDEDGDAAEELPLRGTQPDGERDLELFEGDALTGAGLAAALADVEVAYYLIHSMEHSAGGASFEHRERTSAELFAAGARAAGVRRIVYLGGLVPRWEPASSAPVSRPSSRHLASREEVENTLLSAVPGSLALRASIVIGARSRSFRLLVRLVERMPVMTLPSWHRFQTQPIDARDVIAMLVAAARSDAPTGSLEIGGPDVLSYGEMISRIAELMLVHRPALRLRMSMRVVSSRVAAAIAGEDPELVGALMEGLKGDLLPSHDDAARLLNVHLHRFDSAVEHALADWERSEPLAAR